MDAGEQRLTARVGLDYLKANKSGRQYRILRLETSKFKFYTTVSKRENFSPNDLVSIVVSNAGVGFLDWLSGAFYMPSKERENLSVGESFLAKRQNLNDDAIAYEPILRQNFKNEPDLTENVDVAPFNPPKRELNFASLKPPSAPNEIKQRALNFISDQHEKPKISQLYRALFLGESLGGELRNDIAHWGAAHLLAISGYHLGVLMGVFFLICAPIYRYFSARYFPWRDYKFDLFALGLALAIFYFYIIGFIPSFTRAIFMSALGFLLLVRGFKVLNFQVLFIAVILCVALFPSLIFSSGFYFSCMGVYYIFLYIYYFGRKFGLIAHSLWLNLYVFLAMQAPVLYFFPLISFQQIAVIPLTYLFSIFYPLSFVLHSLGFGGIFDEWLLKFLELKFQSSQAEISLAFFIFYNAVSLLAMKFKPLFLAPALVGIGCFAVFCL